jgi:hypothetical protein
MCGIEEEEDACVEGGEGGRMRGRRRRTHGMRGRRRRTNAWKEEEEALGLFIRMIIEVWGMEVLVEEPHGAWLKVVEGNLYFA